MQAWPKPKEELRSKIGRIATAVAFALVICSFGVGAARADDHHGNDRGRGGDQHHDGGDRDRGRGPNIYYAPQPDYYYAPQPDYYYAPDPYEYYPPQPEYYPPPPPEGINLFFGF